MSIFASQFGYADAYRPSGLDTGTPMVGITTRRPRPKNSKDTSNARQPANASQGSNFEGGAAAAAAGAMGASAAEGAQAMASANSLARQGTLNKTASMERQQEHQDAASTPSVGYGGGNFNVPATKTSGAQPQPHFNPQFGPQPQAQGSPGVLGSIGHFFGSVGHDINEAATNPVVSRILHFGAPPGVPEPGVSNVLQGQVVPRAAAPAGELSSAGPKVVQGHVMTPGEMSGGSYGQKAISPYDYNAEFNNITNQSQFGDVATNPSAWEEVVSGLGDLAGVAG